MCGAAVTNYEGMMAISQILIYQYHIWDIFGLAVKSKVSCEKTQLSDGNHEQGTHSVKMGANSLAENTQNTPKSVQLAHQFCICIVKNRLHWASLVREPISFSSLIMQWWKSEPAE